MSDPVRADQLAEADPDSSEPDKDRRHPAYACGAQHYKT
jgi:hypothetical protein